MGKACRLYVEKTSAYMFLVRKPKRQRPLGRRNIMLEDNSKMDLQEEEWGAWTGLIWLRIGTGDGML